VMEVVLDPGLCFFVLLGNDRVFNLETVRHVTIDSTMLSQETILQTTVNWNYMPSGL
jgi:hypothetical protein